MLHTRKIKLLPLMACSITPLIYGSALAETETISVDGAGNYLFINNESDDKDKQYIISNGSTLYINGTTAGNNGHHHLSNAELDIRAGGTLTGNITSDNSSITINNGTITNMIYPGSSDAIGTVVAQNATLNSIKTGANNHENNIIISDSHFENHSDSALIVDSGKHISITDTTFNVKGTNGGMWINNVEDAFLSTVTIDYDAATTALAALFIHNTDDIRIDRDSKIKSTTGMGIRAENTEGGGKAIDIQDSEIISNGAAAISSSGYEIVLNNTSLVTNAPKGDRQYCHDRIYSYGCGAITLNGGKLYIENGTMIQSKNSGILITDDSDVIISDSSIKSKDTVFIVDGAESSITLENKYAPSTEASVIESTSGKLLDAFNGSNVTLKLENAIVRGDITVDEDSHAHVKLRDNALLVGRLMDVTSAELFSNTRWLVTGDSTVEEMVLGGGVVDFHRAEDGRYSILTLGDLSGIGVFRMNTNLETLQGDFLNITGEVLPSSSFLLAVNNTGREPASATDVLKLVHDQSGQGHFALEGNKVDVGVWQYGLIKDGNNWYLATGNSPSIPDDKDEDDSDDSIDVPEEKPEDNDDSNEEKPANPAPGWSTSPSTDAVMNLAASPVQIFNQELRNLRMRKGEVRNSAQQEGNVWGRYLNSYSYNKTSSYADFNLRQNGFEIGGDKVISMSNGELLVGTFGGYTSNSIENARGGKSKTDSFSFGLYGTWLDQTGFYVDSVLKANSFRNNLHAVMTDGTPVTGRYNQTGLGGTLESGWHISATSNIWLEPYARVSAFSASGSKNQLSNGMKVKITNPRSLQTEAGLHAGTKMAINKVTVAPYVKASIAREHIKNNDVELNDRWSFNNAANGNIGSYGAGVNVALSGSTTVYSELNYQNGKYVEQPISGNLGIRISF